MSKVKHYANFIKFEHSVFALPFALSGALLATNGIPNILTLLWIVIAAVSARSFAMSVNRIVDKDIDLKNPRTKMREIPSGLIKEKEAVLFSIVSLGIFFYSAYQLPIICLKLLPLAAVWFFIYPYMKHITFLCHMWLGVAIGASALAGWIAASGNPLSPVPYILSLSVAFWVSGFDIIYACQDYEHDLKNNLNSIPSKFGIRSALNIAKVFHVLTVLLILGVGLLMELSIVYWLGVAFVIGMLVYEHSLVNEKDLSKVDLAFFTVNGWISVGFFASVLLETIL